MSASIREIIYANKHRSVRNKLPLSYLPKTKCKNFFSYFYLLLFSFLLRFQLKIDVLMMSFLELSMKELTTTNSIDFNHFNYYRWQEEMEKIDSLPTSETNKIKEVYMYSRRGCNLQLIASLFSKLYSKTKDSSQLQIAHFFAMNCIRSLPTILSKFPNLKHLTFVFTPNF